MTPLLLVAVATAAAHRAGKNTRWPDTAATSAPITSPEGPSRSTTCQNLTVVRPGLHWPRDTESLSHGLQPSASRCAEACCAVQRCSHWVWGRHEPYLSHDSKCVTGQPCCWLKGGDTRHLIQVPNANDTIGVLPTRQPPLPLPVATFHVDGGNETSTVLPRMDPRFVSVGCESFEWLFDQGALENPMLQAVTSMLSPGFLRVGGTTSDYMHWVGAQPENIPRVPYPLTGVNTVNTTTFDELIQFCRRVNMSLIYDLNELFGRSRSGGGAWNASGAVALLRHAQNSGAVHPEGPLYAVELGNELQHGPITERTIGGDYAALRQHLDDIFGTHSKYPRLYGPSANSCGAGNNTLAEFLEEAEQAGARLDGLTWHVYPLPKPISDAVLDPRKLRLSPGDCYMKAGRAHSLRLALTESNSNAFPSGGNMGQDRFANGFWYVASLGSTAANGLQFHARWKLWNPRVSYYPGALNQSFGFLRKEFDQVVPDYFVALLHKKLIGDGAALAVQGNNSGVLAWAHCPSRAHNLATAPRDLSANFVLMFTNPLNIPVNATIITSSSLPTQVFDEYILTATDEQAGVLSVFASLNGGEALALDADGKPPTLDGRRRESSTGAVQLPPESYGFVVGKGAALRACVPTG